MSEEDVERARPIFATIVGRLCQLAAVVWAALAALVLWGMLREGPGFGWLLVFLAFASLAVLCFRVGSGVRRRTRGPGAAAAGLVLTFLGLAVVLTLYQDVGKKARWAADQGTIAALRSASAIYYGKNGVFPTTQTLQTLVKSLNLNGGLGADLGCPGTSWSADTTNGRITYTPNTLDAC